MYIIISISIAVIMRGILLANLPKSGPVIRKDSMHFSTSANEIIQRVMTILEKGQRGYRYAQTVIEQNGLLVETRIKPFLWPLFLSTPMKIQIEPFNNECRVNVTTYSQKFITGDIFGFYDRYITDIFISIKSSIEEAEPVAGRAKVNPRPWD